MEVDIQNIYENDPRPTFLVDFQTETPAISHVNPALLAIPHIAQSLHAHDALRDWWDPESRVASQHQTGFLHGRCRWIKFRVDHRWLVVTIVEQSIPTDDHQEDLQEPVKPKLARIASPLLESRQDTIFTVKIQSPELREHIDHVQKVNWSKTSLGAISSWSYELNVLVTTLMLETRPTALFLGPEHTILYNLAYGAFSGSRHPAILGQNIIDAWPELVAPISATMARTEKTDFADAPEEEYHLMVERDGFVEEAFFMWSLVPLVGNIRGMYSMVTEVTKQRLLERRVDTLLKVGQSISKAKNMKDFWANIAQAIEPYQYDFPAAVLYSQCELLDPLDSKGALREPRDRCTLEWTIGYKPDHPDLPQHLNLDKDFGLGRAMSDSAKGGPALVFREEDGVLPEALYRDLEKRAFGDPIGVFLVIPIRSYDATIVGYLLVGLNTRRPYDDEYEDWIKTLSNLLGASATSVALQEEEVRKRTRQEEQAARDLEALNAEVATLTKEASDVAEKLRNFHDIADQVGLGYFEISVDGMMVDANETYFAQTGQRRDFGDGPPFAYKECVYEGDLEMVEKKWEILISGEPATFEIRWKKAANQIHENGKIGHDYLWTLAACVPIKSPDGTVTGVFGCNTDISAQKEATQALMMRSEAERRLASFTELAPVGLFHLNADLSMKYCNDQWFRITDHPKIPMDQVEWRSVVYPDQIERAYREIRATRQKQGAHTFTCHLKKHWKGPDDISTPTWILVAATAYTDDSIMGTMTDISQLKWAEAIQKSRVEEALESKRQQENFIDMTSHEMRNPLSAMVQCADSISSSLTEINDLTRGSVLAAQPVLKTQLNDLTSTSLDAVDTIQACATHQKRIVDDILTLSKLDSKLLVISPIVLQPAALLNDTYKMFKEEANKAHVDLRVRCDESIEALRIDWAVLDPSRVLQVLINLLTNAIKFTQDQDDERRVEVIMGASLNAEKMSEIEYVPQEAVQKDFLLEPEWDGADEVFYLSFTVRDTGCGLSPEHKAKVGYGAVFG
ncbi:BaeS Signal transduction histidine kinase [Pyrenophora tritici-repentis]|nr:BaeS Signal transduction histidine kinase [Pyrenophora tritici-repentis]